MHVLVHTHLKNGRGATSWSHDAAGHTLTEMRTIAGITKTTTYSYNLDGSFASVTYPSGRVINYQMGNAGRMLSAT